MQTGKHTDMQTGRQQADRQTASTQTCRQADSKHTDMQTGKLHACIRMHLYIVPFQHSVCACLLYMLVFCEHEIEESTQARCLYKRQEAPTQAPIHKHAESGRQEDRQADRQANVYAYEVNEAS